MLVTTRDFDDFKKAVTFLSSFNSKTNNRFKLVPTVQELNKKLELAQKEVEIRKQLEKYQTLGINTLSYINKFYSSFDAFLNEMSTVLKWCETLVGLREEYSKFYNKIPVNKRRSFEALLHLPSNAPRALKIWEELKRKYIQGGR